MHAQSPKIARWLATTSDISSLLLQREPLLCAESGTTDIFCEHGHLVVDDKNHEAAYLRCPEDSELKTMPGVSRGQEAQGTAVIN